MERYLVQVPEGAKVTGVTAQGHVSVVLPGEYLVHAFRPKGDARLSTLLRFVGADALCRDVHVPMHALRTRWRSISVRPVVDGEPSVGAQASPAH